MRTLPGSERAWYHWHRTLTLHLRVFYYLRSHLLTDDPHYLPGTQVRHVLRRIKCVSWQSHTQGNRKHGEAGRGSSTTMKPSVHLWVHLIVSYTATYCIIPPKCLCGADWYFWNIYLYFGALEAVDILKCKCNFPNTSLSTPLSHIVSLPLSSVLKGAKIIRSFPLIQIFIWTVMQRYVTTWVLALKDVTSGFMNTMVWPSEDVKLSLHNLPKQYGLSLQRPFAFRRPCSTPKVTLFTICSLPRCTH